MNSEDIERIVRDEIARTSKDEELAEVYRERLRADEDAEAIVDEVQKRRGKR